jgi:hypothetical protein
MPDNNRPIRQPIRRVDSRIDPWGNSLPARSVAGAIYGTPTSKAQPADQPTLRENVGRVGGAAQIWNRLPSASQPSSPTIRRDLPVTKRG